MSNANVQRGVTDSRAAVFAALASATTDPEAAARFQKLAAITSRRDSEAVVDVEPGELPVEGEICGQREMELGGDAKPTDLAPARYWNADKASRKSTARLDRGEVDGDARATAWLARTQDSTSGEHKHPRADVAALEQYSHECANGLRPRWNYTRAYAEYRHLNRSVQRMLSWKEEVGEDAHLCEKRWDWMSAQVCTEDEDAARLLGQRTDEFCEWSGCTPVELAALLCGCVPLTEWVESE